MRSDGRIPKRYIFDALYGAIYLPEFVWDIIPTPELQRLREIRLCNINSLGLTGGANANRYEHAIGTCYLALECLRAWPPLNPIDEGEQRLLILAALLHDMRSAPFGHSVEYIESREGFNHEKAFDYGNRNEAEAAYEYKTATLESIYFGMPREMSSKISEEDMAAIESIIEGRGRLGPLINSKIDLDNIDNVYRLGYHIGIVRSGEVPLELARSLWTENGELIVKHDSLPRIEDWHNVRRRLYEFLLLNPEEFSGKCMLTDAVELAKARKTRPFSWNLVDYEFLEELRKIPPVRMPVIEHMFSNEVSLEDDPSMSEVNQEVRMAFQRNRVELSPSAQLMKEEEHEWRIVDRGKEYIVSLKDNILVASKVVVRAFEISKIISRLMKGDLYGCIAIFSTKEVDKFEILSDAEKRLELEHELGRLIRRKFDSRFKSAIVGLHTIIDVDKTERQVCIQTDEDEVVRIGTSSHQLLIGVFFKNVDLSILGIESLPKTSITRIRAEIHDHLSDF
ncbi:MAG: HD domain-containing protein, partial [Thermoplasmata archaeon]